MNPSIKSLVTRPPGRSLLSRTVTDMPSFCNVIAALSPANPAPITITFLGTREGVIKGLTVTGAVITSAGIVLAATFAVLGLIPLVPLAQLGFAVAFGVLLDTIIVRSILVPALVHEIGPKIWWPSKLKK